MPISKIGSDDVDRWLEWRQTPHLKSESGSEHRFSAPSRSTIQKDSVAFSAVVRHARLVLRIDTTFVPKLPIPAQTQDIRRPRFYPDEWEKIVAALFDRMNSRVGASGPLSEKSIWFRRMLFFFVITLHGTGLRVAEAMRLKVKHLRRVREDAARQEAYRKDLRLTLGHGRENTLNTDRMEIIEKEIINLYQYRVIVGADSQLKHYTHQRTVIPLIEMTTRFDQLLQILALNLCGGEMQTIDNLPAEQWLFCHLDGTRIKSFDNGFDSILTSLGLLYRDDKKRSLTSLRHTYASERIETRAADLKSIADNMGTTVTMLYKHYDQEIRELHAAGLQAI
jgi:integrase